MEYYAPHPNAAFEGYYSKFSLPSGAQLALIICSVPNATERPHMVSLTYYPKNAKYSFEWYQSDHFVADIQRITTNQATGAFELRIPGMGSMKVDADSTTTYLLECEEWRFFAKTTGRVPWDENRETPEGWIARLPLPLHWHVHSLASPCIFKLSIADKHLPPQDKIGEALVHQEKNWANSFPAAHMWIQAHSPSTNASICIAGGKILGMTAYLLGFRSPEYNINFRPPLSLALGWISPFMRVDVDWENRSFSLTVRGFWRKIEVKATAPTDRGWFGLAAPFSDGHRKNFLTESFLARVDVKVWEMDWWGSWSLVKCETFKNASLEFGGEYYPERGEKRD